MKLGVGMGVLVYLDDVIVMSSYLFRLQRLVRPVWPHVHDMWCASEERTDLLLEVRHVLQHGALVGGRPDIVLGRGEGGHNRGPGMMRVHVFNASIPI